MPKISEDIKLWNLVHMVLVGPYAMSVRQKKPGGNIIKKELLITCTTMLYSTFKIYSGVSAPSNI